MSSVSLTLGAVGRLDKVLALAAQEQASDQGLSRVRLQCLIKGGHVTCDGVVQNNPSAKARIGQVYQLDIPPPVEATPQPQNIPLAVLFEDEDLLVLDKPAGLVVHPAAGNYDGTLVNALLFHCGASLSGIGGTARPGIVHRLDKDTSGLMVVAKNDFTHQALTTQFSDRSLSRVYNALVWGAPAPLSGEIEGAIGRHSRHRQKMAVVTRGGKEALTRYKVLEIFEAGITSLVECRLATGRTHQIRVHMAHIGHPVAGDPLYAGRRGRVAAGEKGSVGLLQAFPRQALHAGEISFIHPRTGKKNRFTSQYPADMQALIKALKK